jgi:hypothetical protein
VIDLDRGHLKDNLRATKNLKKKLFVLQILVEMVSRTAAKTANVAPTANAPLMEKVDLKGEMLNY